MTLEQYFIEEMQELKSENMSLEMALAGAKQANEEMQNRINEFIKITEPTAHKAVDGTNIIDFHTVWERYDGSEAYEKILALFNLTRPEDNDDDRD